MTSTNLRTEEENSRKLEKVFQNFLHAEEEWAMEHASKKSHSETEEETELLAQK